MAMKSVLVIGAGPAGLVTAKTLLQYGSGKHFNVSVFEAAERVGGMWRAKADENGDKCSPHMRTNLSRFTVAFSDLSWPSLDSEDSENKENLSSKHTPPPMFPKAWQVGRYLEVYAKKYIPDDTITCHREVTKAELSESEPRKWRITSVNKVTQKTYTNEFDHLVVTSGFFGQPRSNVGNFCHSSKFRGVPSLNTNSGNIVVIGGGISGSEAAASAALQISNAKYAPGPKPAWAESKVVHIINRPFYCMPRYLPQDPYNPARQDFRLAPSFLPLDLVLYNLSRRGEGPISASNGKVPAEKAMKGHEFIRTCIGGDQRELGSAELVHKQDHLQYPSYTGISDVYSEFVRSGLIVPKQGRAQAVDLRLDSDLLEVRVTSEGENHSKVHDVAGVIEATGFKVNVDFLSDDLKAKLEFDPDCNRLPLILGKGSVFSQKLKKELAFVGFYEGPYWAVMEAQAEMVARSWASPSGITIGGSDLFSPSEQLSLREDLKAGELSVPQFWMSDYVGLVEEISREAGIKRNDFGFGGQAGPAFAARYADSASNQSEAKAVLEEVATVLRESKDQGRFAAAATFRGMQGKWTLERKIESRLASMPSGSYKGTAHFHPRNPTDSAYSAEYLYMEEGTLKMDNGYTFPATRRYVYRYSETTDAITAWFTAEDSESVGNFFNKWEFQKPANEEHGWLAKGSHWCSPDTYKNNCEFRFRGASLETFGITYEATGPNKDYTHESWYRRPSLV